MKKFLSLLTALVALLAVIVCVACGGDPAPSEGDETQEPPRIEYEGVYELEAITFKSNGSDFHLSVGDNFLLSKLTSDLATFTLEENGKASFHCNVFSIVKYDFEGWWQPNEKDPNKVDIRRPNDDGTQEALVMTCNGERLSVTLDGVHFEMVKDK